MRHRLLASVVGVCLSGIGCTGGDSGLPWYRTPMAPTPVTAPRPAAPAPVTYNTITIGEVIRTEITAEDDPCVGSEGRCRNYQFVAPADGLFEVVATPTTPENMYVVAMEIYLVGPGAPDDWIVGPGARISVSARIVAGARYEIRMYSEQVPSGEFELRTALQ